MKKEEFIKKCKQARDYTAKAQELTREIFNALSDECVEKPTKTLLAETIGEAITCYIEYGEYNPNDIWHEITHTTEN